MTLNIAALVVAAAGLVVGMPVGLPLVATGLVAWALARAQLKKC
jgi:hypothetical protein